MQNQERTGTVGGSGLDERNDEIARPEAVATRRECFADERDRSADERDASADEREDLAEERERLADEREGTTEQRELRRRSHAEAALERQRRTERASEREAD